MKIDNRSKLQEKLKQANIPTAVHYPTLLTAQPCFSFNSQEFPIADKVSKKVAKQLQKQEVERVKKAKEAQKNA